MNELLNMLVIGGGSAGVRHFRYLTEMGVTCSVCDPAESCRVTNEFPDAEHFRDFDAVELSRFDAVVICTPPFLHVRQAITAAQAGCHILLEKPLSVLNEDGLDELEDIVKTKNLVAAVAFPFANMPAMDRLVEIIRNGEIGTVLTAAVHIGQYILKPRPDYYKTYYASDDQGGGSLQDFSLHQILGLEMLFGPEREVTCQRHTIGAESKHITADDTVWLWLRYRDDIIVNLDITLHCHIPHGEWIISGTEGAIKFLPGENTICVMDGETEEERIEKFDDTWNETFRRNDENFVDALQNGVPVKCPIEQARVNLQTILAARESAKTGKAVKVKRGE